MTLSRDLLCPYQKSLIGKIKTMGNPCNEIPLWSSQAVWSADDAGTFQYAPMVTKTHGKVEVLDANGNSESITYDELIKYIGERKLIQENEAVRKVYERYQVAVKLVRSDDNGDTGV